MDPILEAGARAARELFTGGSKLSAELLRNFPVSAPLDVSLLLQVAGRQTGQDPLQRYQDLSNRFPLVPLQEELSRAVLQATEMRVLSPLPQAEWLTRAQWIEMQASTLREVVSLINGEQAGRAGALLLSVQSGLMLGFLAGRVLGQYDNKLLRSAPAQTVLLAENLSLRAEQMDLEKEDFVRWVLLHELCHSVQFAHASWLPAWMNGRIRALLEERKDSKSPLPSARQREIMKEMQAVMTLLEGHAELIMDRAAPGVVSDVERMRARMEAQREAAKPPMLTLIFRLLGMEQKMAQYRDGRRFCLQVVEQHGLSALNQAFLSPHHVPSKQELEDPAGWLRRLESLTPREN